MSAIPFEMDLEMQQKMNWLVHIQTSVWYKNICQKKSGTM